MNGNCVNTDTLKENQIKWGKQLTDLKKTVDFLSEKFHEIEVDNTLKEEIFKSLCSQASVLQDNLDKVQAQVDEQAQNSYRNLFRINGIKEQKGEDTVSIKINKIKEKMDIETLPNGIDRLHCSGSLKQKELPITFKLMRYNKKGDIFKNKKLLKGKSVSILESLKKS